MLNCKVISCDDSLYPSEWKVFLVVPAGNAGMSVNALFADSMLALTSFSGIATRLKGLIFSSLCRLDDSTYTEILVDCRNANPTQ